MGYLEINITKEIKYLYNENFKDLKKDIEKNTRAPCLRNGKISIAKMTILLKPRIVHKKKNLHSSL